MPRQRTRLNDKDFKLLKKEGMGILGETGHLFPTFGNSIEDFVKFCVYDMNDTYLKSGISEDFESTEGDIRLKPGNDLRKVGFTRGNYKVKYFFYRRLAGAEEIVLTKTVGDQSGVIHSGDPKLTGIPMGAFYVDDDGKVYEGEKPPTDGSKPSELDVKEYKFFIDEISADKTEVRLATQAINSDKYKDEFNNLLYPGGVYTPVTGTSGDPLTTPVMDGRGRFKSEDGAGFEFDTKASTDLGFLKNYQGGVLQVEKAFITGYTPIPNTNENDNWSLEDPIPVITIESNYPDGNATTGTPVIFTAKRENGNVAPSQLSYYWDFGCGHQEFGGPVITHDYTIDGTMNVSVVINSPNFVDTVILDNSLNISYPLDDPESPAAPAPSSPLDGKIIYWDGVTTNGTPQKHSGTAVTTNTRFYVQSGHRRWITSGYNLNLLRDIRGLTGSLDISLYTGLMNSLPVGPQIGGSQLTGAPTGLDEPITDGYLLGSYGETDDDDSGDDSGGDDSGTQDTYYTLNILLKYDDVDDGLSSLPHTISYGDNEPETTIDGYITIDGVNVGGSHNADYLEGTAVNIGIVDDSNPSDNYGLTEWLDGATVDEIRTVVMNSDYDLRAIFQVIE